MPHRKITAMTSAASAQASTLYPIVSGGNANKSITQHTMLKSLGIPQYVEATAVGTATAAFLPASSIMDLYVKAIANSSGGDGGTVVNVGIGTDATYFGTITVSAKGLHRITNVSARNLQSVSGAVVAACPSATAASIFVVGVGYVRT